MQVLLFLLFYKWGRRGIGRVLAQVHTFNQLPWTQVHLTPQPVVLPSFYARKEKGDAEQSMILPWYKHHYSRFLSITLCMEYHFPSPPFQSVSLDLRWVFCRQHIHRTWFCICSASLCLLIGAFSLFTDKVIISTHALITILLIVLNLFFVSLFLLLFLFSCDMMSIFNVKYGFHIFFLFVCINMAFPDGSVEESACQCRRHGFNPWPRKIPWRREWQPPPVFLPGKPHGQRNLVSYSPWGRKEFNMT